MSTDMDRLVAEKVMGFKIVNVEESTETQTIIYQDEMGMMFEGFFPTTNLNEAWLALDKVCMERDWRANMQQSSNQNKITFINNDDDSLLDYCGVAETMELAICKAVLQVVGEQV